MARSSPIDFEGFQTPGVQPPPDRDVARSGASRAQHAALEHQGLSGARWFYWIAALSLLNSLIQVAGAELQFVIGLGTMQVIGALAEMAAQAKPEIAILARGIGLVINVFLAALVALFGWLCTRRSIAAFIVGMGLYLIDGLILVLLQDWYSAGFHAFALFCIWQGMSAYRRLNALEADSLWTEDTQLAPAAD